MGLAICKELIERMSGSIGFQSQVGHGSTFYFELPIWSDQELVSTPQLLPGSMSASRILVVEDEPDIANLLMVILNQRGYNVDIAPDAATAYTLATSIDYDAITLDLILPDCSGVDLLQQLRSEVRTANIPVVMVSAYVEEGALAISSAASVIDWVKKPFDPGRLIEAVNRAIKVRNSAESTSQMHVLHVEDEIDFARVIQASTPPDLKLDHASSLAQARRFLASKAYDVVIIDVGLPDGNGLHLINDIRSISPPPEVIVLSGLDLDPSELEVVQAVLKKSPDSTEKVLQLLDSQLKSKAQS